MLLYIYFSVRQIQGVYVDINTEAAKQLDMVFIELVVEITLSAIAFALAIP